MSASDPIGVLLLTYGSPERREDVAAYMTNVRGGKAPDPEVVKEFERRYEVIGGSPLLARTREQAQAAAEKLEEIHGVPFRGYVGMRFWHPTIAEAMAQMEKDGVKRAVALIMSPQYSPILMKGYLDAVEAAKPAGMEVASVETWWDEPLYQQAVAERIEEALDSLPEEVRGAVPLLLTAHSIPRSVYEKDPDYVEQLKATAEAIAARVDHPSRFAYQSAGHAYEEWLQPDMVDLFPEFAEQGHTHVVIAPAQFLADHLEILYDIDVAAAEQAEKVGLTMVRTPSLNDHPTFIAALAAIIGREAAAAGWLPKGPERG